MSNPETGGLSRRERWMWIYRIVGPVGALALAALALPLVRRPSGGHAIDAARIGVGLVVVVVIMAWSFTFAWLTARREDEYTLTAAKYAWFWGGLIGLVCSVPVLAFIAWGGLALIDPAAFPPSRQTAFALTLGYMLAVVFQLVGYIIARVWWGRRRA